MKLRTTQYQSICFQKGPEFSTQSDPKYRNGRYFRKECPIVHVSISLARAILLSLESLRDLQYSHRVEHYSSTNRRDIIQYPLLNKQIQIHVHVV